MDFLLRCTMFLLCQLCFLGVSSYKLDPHAHSINGIVKKKTPPNNAGFPPFSLENQFFTRDTLPKTDITPENRPSQNEISSSNHPFSGAMLVSGRVVSTSIGYLVVLHLLCYGFFPPSLRFFLSFFSNEDGVFSNEGYYEGMMVGFIIP